MQGAHRVEHLVRQPLHRVGRDADGLGLRNALHSDHESHDDEAVRLRRAQDRLVQHRELRPLDQLRLDLAPATPPHAVVRHVGRGAGGRARRRGRGDARRRRVGREGVALGRQDTNQRRVHISEAPRLEAGVELQRVPERQRGRARVAVGDVLEDSQQHVRLHAIAHRTTRRRVGGDFEERERAVGTVGADLRAGQGDQVRRARRRRLLRRQCGRKAQERQERADRSHTTKLRTATAPTSSHPEGWESVIA